jgi:predicted transcriptional regulator
VRLGGAVLGRAPAGGLEAAVLVRLWRKGRLQRRKSGRAYAYRAGQSRERYVAGRMEEILALATDRPAALAAFAARLSEEDRAALAQRLSGRERP